MSKWFQYHNKFNNELENLYQRKKDAEDNRHNEYMAAVKIQSWYRGNNYRLYLKMLNKQANCIQRHWRGFLGKKEFRDKLKESLDKMCWTKYIQSSVKIQSRWRGYKTRRYDFDYYDYRRKMARITEANEKTLSFINQYQENMEKEEMLQLKLEHEQKMKMWAEKNHFLISTKAQPGIYNSPFIKHPSIKEHYLKTSERVLAQQRKKQRPLSNQEKRQEKTLKTASYEYDPAFVLSNKEPSKTSLPPITFQKPQGPFRDPAKVQAQRYKPLRPSLRVMTDFYSLEKAREAMQSEEWTKRLHDDNFMPVMNRESPYQPMLITSSEYGPIQYGTVHFRELDINSRNTINNSDPFKNVVPPIQVFEKVPQQQYIENYSV